MVGRTELLESVLPARQPPDAWGGGGALPKQDRIKEVQQALQRAKLPFGAKASAPMALETYEFKHDKKDYNVYWDVRKGLIPIVGAARETGAGGLAPALLHPPRPRAGCMVFARLRGAGFLKSLVAL